MLSVYLFLDVPALAELPDQKQEKKGCSENVGTMACQRCDKEWRHLKKMVLNIDTDADGNYCNKRENCTWI